MQLWESLYQGKAQLERRSNRNNKEKRKKRKSCRERGIKREKGRREGGEPPLEAIVCGRASCNGRGEGCCEGSRCGSQGRKLVQGCNNLGNEGRKEGASRRKVHKDYERASRRERSWNRTNNSFELGAPRQLWRIHATIRCVHATHAWRIVPSSSPSTIAPI